MENYLEARGGRYYIAGRALRSTALPSHSKMENRAKHTSRIIAPGVTKSIERLTTIFGRRESTRVCDNKCAVAAMIR
jgi:hypothetical protein